MTALIVVGDPGLPRPTVGSDWRVTSHYVSEYAWKPPPAEPLYISTHTNSGAASVAGGPSTLGDKPGGGRGPGDEGRVFIGYFR